MAPKRNPMEDPPTASSSDEEEEASSEEEEDGEKAQKGDSSSEEEDDADEGERGSPPRFNRNPAANLPESGNSFTVAVARPTEAQLQQASDATSGSDTETESDSETGRRDRIANREYSSKAVVKSVEQNRNSKKTKSSDTLSSPVKSTNKRRSKTEQSPNDAKRIKKDLGGKSGTRADGMDDKKPGDDAKRRLWSENDEIAVLKGMIDFKSDTGVNPFDDMHGFYEFVKKSISFDVSKIQFMDKIRSLKKKYVNNLSKGKNCEDPSFAKPHDQKAFELSKNVWGTDGAILDSAVKSNGKSMKKNQRGKMITYEALKQELFPPDNSKKEGDNRRMEIKDGEMKSSGMNKNDDSEIPIDSITRSLGVDEHSLKQGWSMVALEDKKTLEKKWKALQVREMCFLKQKSEFLHEVAVMIAEAIRSSD